ncbi:MAG: hypothetical protein N2C14_21255, partial [Planctomycetales bacterium]
PDHLRERFQQATREKKIHDLEMLWYEIGDEQSPFARDMIQLVSKLGDLYQVEELEAKYDFTGRTEMTVPKALEIKEELESIDDLLEQLKEAAETAQIGIIDLEELAKFAEPGDVSGLSDLQKQVQDYLRDAADRQG